MSNESWENYENTKGLNNEMKNEEAQIVKTLRQAMRTYKENNTKKWKVLQIHTDNRNTKNKKMLMFFVLLRLCHNNVIIIKKKEICLKYI